MKKSIIFLLLATAFLFTACEQPEGPQSLIGHWKMVGDHWTADFDENGELTISSVKYDCFHPYYYEATADSLYIYAIAYTESGWAPSGTPYVCSYAFHGSPTLAIDGFNAIFQDMGSVADKIQKKERVVLTRTSSFR
jgi:hypothetical protein